jgi:hypothetical protein
MKTLTAVKMDPQVLLKASATRPAIVDVPAFQFLMVDGTGDPNTSTDFQNAIQALFGLSYGVHFALKKSGIASRVWPLEGLFWTDKASDFMAENKGKWRWTLMIMQPDDIDQGLLQRVRLEAERKKPNPLLARTRLEEFKEGPAAQIMHIGPYSTEKPTIDRLHAFIGEEGYRLHGKHHEIYLGDPRRAAPEKLRTLVRQPITR